MSIPNTIISTTDKSTHSKICTRVVLSYKVKNTELANGNYHCTCPQFNFHSSSATAFIEQYTKTINYCKIKIF